MSEPGKWQFDQQRQQYYRYDLRQDGQGYDLVWHTAADSRERADSGPSEAPSQIQDITGEQTLQSEAIGAQHHAQASNQQILYHNPSATTSGSGFPSTQHSVYQYQQPFPSSYSNYIPPQYPTHSDSQQRFNSHQPSEHSSPYHGGSSGYENSAPMFQISSQETVVPPSNSRAEIVNLTLNNSEPAKNTAPDRGEGISIEGKWNPNVPTIPHYEPLDKSFYVRHSSFFVEGKMFSVLFPEPLGSTATQYNDSVSIVKFGVAIHSQIRRFIVVQRKPEFCYACPVFTYGGRATTKRGLRPWEHSVVHTTGTDAQLLPNETGIKYLRITVDPAPDVEPLHPASRIYFGIHHPIQYNVRVKDLGQVIEPHVPRLLGYWVRENKGM